MHRAGQDGEAARVAGWVRDAAAVTSSPVPASPPSRRGRAGSALRAVRGILKTATISFGQSLQPRVLAAARDAALGADLFLAAGTSLTVQPAATLAGVAVEHGARLVIVNAEPTPYDERADAVLRHRLGEVLPLLFGGLAA